jgi:cytochrome c-type biogenesis protein
MDGLLVSIGTAFWLGILTSISPCPLATNIAAVSYIARQIGSTRRALVSALLYSFGRIIAYVGLGAIVVAGLLSIPAVSNFLQDYMDKILGPLLVLTGLFLLDIIHLNIPGFQGSGWTRNLAEKSGSWGAVLLGCIFALSLCPVSAALFFGSLVPLAVQHKSYVLLPSIYGAGTGLPVVACGLVIAFGAGSLGKFYARLTAIEKWVRLATAIVIIAIGIHFILRYIFDLY